MVAKKTASVWETLSVIDCNDHTEEKNGLTYLSWAWAWGTLKKHYPSARFDKMGVETLEDGTSMVRVRVWIPNDSGDGNIEDVTEFLPVLDYKNKAIQKPNAFDVNSSYQRCLVKCLAYMGLGMYIYQGEKLNPESTPVYTVKSVEGNVQETEDLIGLANIFLTFMEGNDLNSLRQFWAMNKQPLEHLERLDPENYKRVFDAFTLKANELKETNNG